MGEIWSGGRKISSEALQARVSQAATGLVLLGVGRSDAVALYLRNDLAFFEAHLATGRVGAYAVPVNWHYGEDEASYLLVNSQAKVVIVHADLYGPIKKAIPEDVTVLIVPTPDEIRDAYGIASDRCAVPAGMIDWNVWIDQFSPSTEPPGEPPDTVIYTSGTTGRPKGVRRAPPTAEQAQTVLSILSRGFGFESYLLNPADIVTVITGPMYHSAPNAFGALAARIGATIFLQPRFDPEELLRMVEAYRVTHLHMVPIMFNRLLKLPEAVKAKYDLSSLRFVVHAAAPCPAPIKREMIEWWGPIIHEYYGSTETGMVVFCDSKEWLAHPGTVGRAFPEASVEIIDDNGSLLPRGEIGEIICKLNNVADFTYYGDDEKRRQAARGNLIAPGDIGYIDDDGFLYLCDRANDMIISGGVNIYPAEIESQLHKMPGVADCAVFGIPDDEYGEAVCAAVQASPGALLSENEVKQWLRQHIAGYKVPSKVDLCAELPREDSGKIFKRKLREPYWAALDRQI